MEEPISEKQEYDAKGSPSPSSAHFVDANGVENKTGRLAEAAGVYGDIQTAEEYGYVTRGYAA